jgi:epoxyqueuosine reductase
MPTEISNLDKGVVDGLQQEAHRLGFSRLGITSAEPPPRQDRFAQWLDQGFAGVMENWLRRHLPLRSSPESLLPGTQSVIMLATDYDAKTVSSRESPNHGQIARYAVGRDYHDVLRSRLNHLGGWLEHAIPGCKTRGVVDSAPLAEREFAARAGLGWFGKNTMLIDQGAGSYFFLSGLLATVALPTHQPIEVDHCGTCTACLDICPTDALPEPRVLDATRCISALTIEDRGPVEGALRSHFGNWIFGCDLCQEVCPWNRHAPGTKDPELQAIENEEMPSLIELLRLDQAAFRNKFHDSPILRAKRVGLLRSAAIALGNHPSASGDVPAGLASLCGVLQDKEPVIRGAAAWALGQWRYRMPEIAPTIVDALKARLAEEYDETVRQEIFSVLSHKE